VGAALARPARAVVAVIGDGSAMYGVQALWTAARERLPITVIILDNAEYAAVRLLGQAAGSGKLPGTALGGLDFVRLARGMGSAARRVEDPRRAGRRSQRRDRRTGADAPARPGGPGRHTALLTVALAPRR
jgi:thiamine pyrophosphate-dependent acetolactate synthase large subunit-like protein